jgi:hypothetical protein
MSGKKVIMVALGIPETHNLVLRQLGRLAVAHGNLEMVQVMCLKILEGLAPDEAVKKYRETAASKIRKKIIAHIAASSLTKDEKDEIEEQINEAWDLSEKRNGLSHRFWGTVGGEWRTSPDEDKWEPIPSPAYIKDLVGRIEAITKKINYSRRKGTISKAAARPAR